MCGSFSPMKMKNKSQQQEPEQRVQQVPAVGHERVVVQVRSGNDCKQYRRRPQSARTHLAEEVAERGGGKKEIHHRTRQLLRERRETEEQREGQRQQGLGQSLIPHAVIKKVRL